jgi:predicted CXXCH cytochrome family protein
MACHTADKHVMQTEHSVLGAVRCASCHLEHNEPPQLVKRHQGLCADCHRDIPDDVELGRASDFLDAHPDFKVSLLMPTIVADGNTEWELQRLLLTQAQTADRSNLKFDHKVHLDETGILTPDGPRVVECIDCHQLEPGGARMQAITMDEHCSGCHALNFDADDPSRTVPHGDPEGVLQALIEYYSAKLLGADSEVVEQRVRRPGQSLSRADRDRAAAEARVQALAVAEDLFERRACVNCHEVRKRDSNEEMPWYVAPVRLTESFFPHASFSHAAHDTEVTSCDGCHNATASQSSADVLIPGIAVCRDCHGSGVARRNNASQTPSTCIMCHSFHFPAKGPHQ